MHRAARPDPSAATSRPPQDDKRYGDRPEKQKGQSGAPETVPQNPPG